MNMNFKSHMVKYPLIIVAAILMTSLGIRQFVLQDSDPIYKPQKVDTKTLGRMPVESLLGNIKNGRWHMLVESFSDAGAFEKFKSHFSIDESDQAGIFGKASFIFKSVSVTTASKEELADCSISIVVYQRGHPDKPVTIQCNASYNDVGKQYVITAVKFSGEFEGPFNEGDTPEVPQISESPCAVGSDEGFVYIRPRSRLNENSTIEPNIVLGGNPNQEFEIIPDNFYNTDAIKQAAFGIFTFRYENPKWTACREVSPKFICDGLYDRYITETYDPGYMVTQQDVINNEMKGVLFSFIKDGEGVMQVPKDNQLLNYPTGFFLDAGFKRLTALSSKNEIIHYGEGSNHYHFQNPVALAIAGNFIYVLDGAHDKTLAMFRYFLNDSGDLALRFEGTTDLQTDLSYAVDISGYRGDDRNILYIADKNKESISRFELDPETGLRDPDASPKEFKQYRTLSGERLNLKGIEKIKVSPRSEEDNDVILATLNYNQVAAFSATSEPDLTMNFKYEMPLGSRPVSIGYNLGNNTFIISDLYANRMHIFSNSGAYLGAGGKTGLAEDLGELFRPAIVSSNNFANDAVEFVVANNTWAVDKGFKRFIPQADIGKIEVIEKTATGFENINDNELIFRYALTASNDIKSVILKLNGQVIKNITGPFYPDILAENFSATQSGPDGIADEIKVGWNTYQVELTANIPGPSNANLQYKKVKSMDFFFLPSVLNDPDLVIGSGPQADFVHDKTNNPFYVYKNMLIEGSGQLRINDGRMVLARGCTLKIAKERILLATSEDFEFECGANLQVNTTHDIPKVFKNSNFNGTFYNYNMVSTRGDYTGGVGSGSAPSSMLEFITCNFSNYLGKALHVVEGRATVVNSTFTTNIDQNPNKGSATAVAIVVDPQARLDVRGGEFLNNDIALDGNNSVLSVGRHGNTYKEVKLEDPLFEKNKIAIHVFSSNTELKNSVFKNNQACAIDLNGSLDLSNNAENSFENNVQAIIFSKNINGGHGNNKFIDNNVDVTYLLPEGDVVPATFDFECNYWLHGTTSGTPVIDIAANPPYDASTDLIHFITAPYLVKKGNVFTCTDKGGRLPTSEPIVNTAQPFQNYYDNVMRSLLEKADNYKTLSKVISSHNRPITIGSYTEDNNLSLTFQKAVVKNSIFTYVYRRNRPDALSLEPQNYDQAYSYFTPTKIEPDHFVEITRDRVAFLQFFLREKQKVAAPEEITETQNSLDIFPNPTTGLATLIVSPAGSGYASLVILNSSGRVVRTIAENLFLEAAERRELPINMTDLPNGVYFVRMNNKAVKKFIKK
jgi:hypothetical protein